MAKLSEIGTECADLHYARPGLCKSVSCRCAAAGRPSGERHGEELASAPVRTDPGGRPSGDPSIKFPSGTDRARFASPVPQPAGGRQKTPHCRRRIVPALLCYVRRAGPFVGPSGPEQGGGDRGCPWRAGPH